MMNENKLKTFVQEHRKIIIVFCAFTAVLILAMIIYMHEDGKRATGPVRVKNEEMKDSDAVQKNLKVDSRAADDISREIRYIDRENVVPAASYVIEAPTIEKAADITEKEIKDNDPGLPAAATEKTDRTVVATDPQKQKVDVYKINLRNNHKIKAGILTADGKTYVGAGYQAGRWETAVYTHTGRQVEAGSVMYTVKQW